MITFKYIGFTIKIHSYSFYPGYKATLEEPGEEDSYLIEDVTVTDESGNIFDDCLFFDLIDVNNFYDIATEHIIKFKKSLM